MTLFAAVPIPSLPASGALTGAELFIIDQSGTTCQLSLNDIATFVGGGGFSFSNGLTAAAGVVKLGGALTGNTSINGAFSIQFSGVTNFQVDSDNIIFSDMSGDQVMRVGPNGPKMHSTGLFDFTLDAGMNQALFTDSRGTPTGIEYAADYSATYTSRSLVDYDTFSNGSIGTLLSGSHAITGNLTINDGGGINQFQFSAYPGLTTIPAFYMGVSSITNDNYTILSDGTTTVFQCPLDTGTLLLGGGNGSFRSRMVGNATGISFPTETHRAAARLSVPVGSNNDQYQWNNFGGVEWQTGPIATWWFLTVKPDELSAVGASTLTNAYGIWSIPAATKAGGGNLTITNKWGFGTDAGIHATGRCLFGISARTPKAIVDLGPASTSIPHFNLDVASGTPSSPTDGNIWFESNTTTGLKMRINGVTETFSFGASTPSLTSTYVGYGIAGVLGGTSDFNYAPATGLNIAQGLFVNSVTATTSATDISMTLSNNSSGTPAAGYGISKIVQLKSTTTNNRVAGKENWYWTTATDASRQSGYSIQLVGAANVGVLQDAFTIWANGNSFAFDLSTHTGYDPLIRFKSGGTALGSIELTSSGGDMFISTVSSGTSKMYLRAGVGSTVLTLSTSIVTVASGIDLQLGNAATTGLVAGVVAGLTNATITLKDSTGQVYRIPCVI